MGIGRRLASAAILGTTVALIGDVLLQGALSLVRVDDVGYRWLEGAVFERSRWIVAAILVWAAAPSLERTIADSAQSLAGPPLAGRGRCVPWVWRCWRYRSCGRMASLLLRALMISIAGEWSIDGRLFTSSYFYSNLVMSYAPWAMGGAVLCTLAYHAAPGPDGLAAAPARSFAATMPS